MSLRALATGTSAVLVGVSVSMVAPHAELPVFLRVVVGAAGAALATALLLRCFAWVHARLEPLPRSIRRLAVAASVLGGPILIMAWPMRAPSETSEWLAPLLRLAWAGEISIGLLVLFAFFAQSPSPQAVFVSRRRDFILPSGLLFVILIGVYWLAFYPGLMTSDSLDQWQQAMTLRINNHHPAFHTGLIWLITRVWASAAAVSLCQIAFFALVVGWLMHELAAWGTPVWARTLVSLLLALSPVNGVMLMTLWKDIAFSIGVILLSGLWLRAARLGADVWRRKAFLVANTVTLIALCLLRHNGIALAVGMLALIPLSARSARLPIAGSSIISVCVASFIVGPLYDLMGIGKMSPMFKSGAQLQHIGAVIQKAPPLTLEQRTLLQRVLPLETWRSNYNCFSTDPLFYESNINTELFDNPLERRRFHEIWLDLVLENPMAVIDSQMCMSSMLWRVHESPGGYIATYALEAPPSALGFSRESVWPAAHAWLTAALQWSIEPKQVWWFWRPALYVYFALFAVTSAVIRTRRVSAYGFLLPSCILFATLAALMPVQDFRYAYAMYLTGLIGPLFLCMKRAP